MRRQSRLSLDRLIEMHGQMMQIWEDLDRGFPLSERLPKTCQEDPESWAPDPFGPVYKSQHVIAYLILDYRPAMKPRRRSGWISCGLLSGTLRTMTAGPRKIARISRPEISPPISCCGTPELREGLQRLEQVGDAPQAAGEPGCHAA